MKDFLRNNKWLLFLNSGALIFYFAIISSLGGMEFIHDSLFSTVDSKDYLEYAKWISGENDFCNPVRSFFYPLIVMLSISLGGLNALWFIQFLLWIAACNLIFITVRKLTLKVIPSAIAFIIAASNISLIVYTAHGLTEITVYFFLALFMFLLSLFFTAQKKISILIGMLLIASLLVVTKPVYYVLWYLLILSVLIYSLKEMIKKPILILWLLFVCSPVIIQKIIAISTSDSFITTRVADYNLKNYFFMKALYYEQHKTLEGFDMLPDSSYKQMRDELQVKSNIQILNYLISHPLTSAVTFIDNVKDNQRSGNPYIESSSKKLYKWTQNLNDKFYYLHFGMFFLWMFFLIKNFKKKKSGNYLFLFFAGMLTFYVLYYPGITFWAGDRLIAPALACWSSSYVILFVFLLGEKKKPELF